MFKQTIFLTVFLLFFCLNGLAQTRLNTTFSLNYSKIYALGLDGNLQAALPLMDVDTSLLSKKDKVFKAKFELRFKNATDSSPFISVKEPDFQELLYIFRDYWRNSLLDSTQNFDAQLAREAILFLKNNFLGLENAEITRDSIGSYLSQFIRSKGYFTTKAVQKTGTLYDLLIWKSQKDTTYFFSTKEEVLEIKVVMMKDFVTLGWEEYATLGRYYPGGWTTKNALYCVKDAYNLDSENFLISYLAHESRHFTDYKIFPKLKSTDLEYRAKLTELSLAKTTLFNLIEFFINNSNSNNTNAHSAANYFVIRDLSRILFSSDFERDIQKWKTVKGKKINKMANKLLKINTNSLHEIGTDVENYIK